MRLVASLDNRFYPGIENYWDDRAFRAFVLERLSSEHHLLDLGAGAGILPEMNFRGHAARVFGIDPDLRVTQNSYLDEGIQGFGEMLPYPNESFDIVIADNVLEHLTQPDLVFSEVKRVLKPSGRFLFKTPNRNHYMPLIARLTPHSFHVWFNRVRGRNDADTFPTIYKANSRRSLSAIARRVGFVQGEMRFIESRPEYLRMTSLTYLAGIAYERIVNSTSALARFRIVLIGELIKSPL